MIDKLEQKKKKGMESKLLDKLQRAQISSYHIYTKNTNNLVPHNFFSRPDLVSSDKI